MLTDMGSERHGTMQQCINTHGDETNERMYTCLAQDSINGRPLSLAGLALRSSNGTEGQKG